MAAVTGYVDDLVTLRDVLHAFDVVDLDPVVNLVPEPAQHHFQKADRGVGVVGGNFVGVTQRLGLGFVGRNVFALGFFEDRLTHGRFVDQAFDQVAAVRQVGADHGGFQVAKVNPQDALGHAHGAFVTFVVVDQFAQVNGRRKLHAGLAAQNQDAQQTAQAPGDGPAVGKQQLPGARFAVGGLAPEHADRDDLRIFAGVQRQAVHQSGEGRRSAALVLTAQPVGLGRQVEERGRLDHLPDGHRQHRARQARLGALGINHGQFGNGGRLQDVEHWPAAVQVQGERRLINGLRAYP